MRLLDFLKPPPTVAVDPVSASEPPELDPEMAKALATVDPTDGKTPFDRLRCAHCGGAHLRACPRVKRMRWAENGRLIEVEFWPAGEWSTDGIIWPEAIGAVDAPAESTEVG